VGENAFSPHAVLGSLNGKELFHVDSSADQSRGTHRRSLSPIWLGDWDGQSADENRALNLDNLEDLRQVNASINNGSCGIDIDFSTRHMALLPPGPETSMGNNQGEHSGDDTEAYSFEEKVDPSSELFGWTVQ
jgi:hypothetical protein